MKIALTGYNGFLAKKLRARTEFEWTQDLWDANVVFHLGSPTFTQHMSKHDSIRMHEYVKDTINLIDDIKVPFVFASTTGVLNMHYNHDCHMTYDVSKLYLENYIINNCENYLILRIGTIYSKDINDVKMMKQDRVQPRVMNKDTSGIPFEDYYLNVDVFIDTTIEALTNIDNRIIEYPLEKLSMIKLIAK